MKLSALQKTLFVATFSAMAITTAVVVRHGTGGNVGTGYSQIVRVVSVTNSVANGTSIAVSITNPVVPVGDTVTCDLITANIGTAPGSVTGWTTIKPPAPVLGVLLQSYQRVVQAGDSSTYTFTVATAQALRLACTWWHAAASPVFSSIDSTASGVNVSTLSLAPLTINSPAIVPVEVVAQNTAATTRVTDSNFPGQITAWDIPGSGLSATAITTSSLWSGTNPVSGQPVFTNTGSTVAEVLVAMPIVAPFTVAQAPVGPATPAPATSTPTPPPTHIMTAIYAICGYVKYGNGMTKQNFTDGVSYAEGPSHISGAPNPGATCAPSTNANELPSFCVLPNCMAGTYENVSEWEQVNNGTSANLPMDSNQSQNTETGAPTCNATLPNNMLQTVTTPAISETAFEHIQGGSITAANRIGSLGTSNVTGDTYYWPINKSDTGFKNFVVQEVQGCSDGNGNNWNDYTVFRNDNNTYELYSNGWDFGAGYFTYGKNIGYGSLVAAKNVTSDSTTQICVVNSVNTPCGYASGKCSNLVGGSTCLTSASLSTITTGTAECSNDTTNTCYNGAFQTLFSALKHIAGNAMLVGYNGARNTDLSLLTGTSNVRFAIQEHPDIDAGSWTINGGDIQSGSSIESALDNACTYAKNAPAGDSYSLIDTMSGTNATSGGWALGTQAFQQRISLHQGLVWLCHWPYYMDWADMNYAAGSNGMVENVFAYQFLFPTNPVQTAGAAYNAAAGTSSICGTGTPNICDTSGSHDPAICIYGTAPNCVFRREFTDVYWQPNFTSSATGQIDIGKTCTLVNLTGSAQTIQTSWCTQWSALKHIMAQCTPTTAVANLYWTATSTANTSLSQAITGSSTAQNVSVSSSSGFAVGAYISVGGDSSTGVLESVKITAIPDSTHITGVFLNHHNSGNAIEESVCATAASSGDIGGPGTGTGPGVLDFTTPKATLTTLQNKSSVTFTAY